MGVKVAVGAGVAVGGTVGVAVGGTMGVAVGGEVGVGSGVKVLVGVGVGVGVGPQPLSRGSTSSPPIMHRQRIVSVLEITFIPSIGFLPPARDFESVGIL